MFKKMGVMAQMYKEWVVTVSDPWPGSWSCPDRGYTHKSWMANGYYPYWDFLDQYYIWKPWWSVDSGMGHWCTCFQKALFVQHLSMTSGQVRDGIHQIVILPSNHSHYFQWQMNRQWLPDNELRVDWSTTRLTCEFMWHCELWACTTI
jgi:hypothetical protein